MTDIYIIGAGDFGRETADTIAEINDVSETWYIAGFIDDDSSMIGTVINGIEVVGNLDYLLKLSRDTDVKPICVITIANPRIKKAIANKLENFVTFANIIHPRALITKSAKIGVGNIIQHFTSVNSNACVGNHCILNTGVCIGHDVNVGDYASVMPLSGAMGDCVLEEGVYIGVGAVVIPGKRLGAYSTIGAGAVVVKDVDTAVTVVGNPARPLK
ncbi:MAG: acetyltransferase [Clostridiales Family XIII bacterium]|jgi:sugar O-acyltransferase (sialic acid O-acetyltransferase NeuD family)|nr:acetyltransferase [Clostridiales Family XIII bacterium]